MTHATLLWSIWQALLQPFAWVFTRPGHRRFVEWITALALNVEEHTITQSVLTIERPADGKAMETFAETGAGPTDAVARTLARLVEKAPGRIGHGYHVSAVDDTKVHRSGEEVWGTCTFHEDTARCPNRATTVRAHNGVILGALLQNPDQPAWFLPVSGRLYFRKAQVPPVSGSTGPVEVFRTKCERAVGLLREQARTLGGKHVGVFDGGFARKSVVRPLVAPEDGSPRIEFRTRLRHDARWHAPRPPRHRAHQKGGQKLAPPRQGGRWSGPWQEGTAFLYGRMRKVRGKEVVCLGRVLGHDIPIKVVVAKVEGSQKRFTLVTSALELTGLQMVELFAARFRQEDGFRDLKQRLGWEEWRAGTRNPIERTSQAQGVTLSLLRLAQFRLEAAGEVDWWYRPPWNRTKERPSVWDGERLLRRHRGEILQRLSEGLGDEGNVA